MPVAPRRSHRTAGRRRNAPVDARRENLARRRPHRLHISGRHLDRARHRGRRHAPHGHARLRVEPRVEPRQPPHRVRLGPQRQFRHLRDGRRRRSGSAADLEFGLGNSRDLLGRRQGGMVFGCNPGPDSLGNVPHRTHDPALRRVDRHRRVAPAAGHPRQINNPLARRRRNALHGCKRVRGRVAQAPHIVGDTRHLALRCRHRHPHQPHEPSRRRPRPGV